MNHAIATQMKDFFPAIYPRELKRNKTPGCVSNAINVINDYCYYRQISKEEGQLLKREIKAAPHDDAVSNIMTKLRLRIYG